MVVVVMVMIILFVVVLIGFFLGLPLELEKVIDRATEPKRAIGLVAIDFSSFV